MGRLIGKKLSFKSRVFLIEFIGCLRGAFAKPHGQMNIKNRLFIADGGRV